MVISDHGRQATNQGKPQHKRSQGEYIQVTTTVAGKEEAEALALMLVDRRLAACVQVIGPISSHYRWLGKIESSGEYLCLAKSRRELYPAIEAAIKEVHPYQVPEIIATSIVAGNSDYLAWLDAEAGKPD